MTQHNHGAQYKHVRKRQPNDQSQDDHADTNGPYRVQTDELVTNIKAEDKIEKEYLNEH